MRCSSEMMDVTPEQSVLAACRSSLVGEMDKWQANRQANLVAWKFVILVCYSLSDGDDTWNADDGKGAVDLSVSSVASENHLDHDIITGELAVLACCQWLLCRIR